MAIGGAFLLKRELRGGASAKQRLPPSPSALQKPPREREAEAKSARRRRDMANLGTPGLTDGYDPSFARKIEKTKPGMACWADGGPFGAICNDCAFFGHWRQIKNDAGDTVKSVFRSGACRKFFALTNKHGDTIPPKTEACRYFKRKESG
jgi:hypothetical protein